MLGHK